MNGKFSLNFDLRNILLIHLSFNGFNNKYTQFLFNPSLKKQLTQFVERHVSA